MNCIPQLLTLLGFWATGQIASILLAPLLPIPGAIAGMLLLWLALSSGVLEEQRVSSVGDFFLGNISLFFVAPCIAIMAVADSVADIALKLTVLAVVSTAVTMAAASVVTDRLLKKGAP